MNTLNKAFIKAFAKDRTKALCPRTDAPSVGEAFLEAPAPSVSLTMHDLYVDGDRFRIDAPPHDGAPAMPEAHLSFAPVQFVETFDPSDPHAVAAESVIVEDRMVGDPDAGESDISDFLIAWIEIEELAQPRADQIPEAADAADVELDASELAEEDESQPEPEPEIETTWGYDVGHDRPDIGQGASVEIADEAAGDETHVAVIAPELKAVDYESDGYLRSLCGVEFGLPSSTDLNELKPGSFPVAIPQWPPATPETHDEPSPANKPGTSAPDTADHSENSAAGDPAPPHDDASLLNTLAPTTGIAEDQDPVEADAEETDLADSDTVPVYQPWPQLEPMTIETKLPGAEAGQFGAAWEVDAFCWPEVCAQLDAASNGQLGESGEEIAAAAREGLKVLAVTSIHRQEGRTTLALALARHAAAAGSRVALLDADAGNPELTRQLGLEAPCSWQDVVGQQQPLTEAAVYSLEDGVTLFPLTKPSDGDLGALDDALLAQTLRALSASFDLIVVDMYPVEMYPAALFSVRGTCLVDMAVVVRDTRSTGREQTLQTVASLREAGVKAVGVAENYLPR